MSRVLLSVVLAGLVLAVVNADHMPPPPRDSNPDDGKAFPPPPGVRDPTQGDRMKKPRQLDKFEVRPAQVEIESQSRDADTKSRNSLKIKFAGQSNHVDIRMEYKQRTADSGAMYRFALGLGRIVEYVESGATAGFTPGQDAVYKNYTIGQSPIMFAPLPDGVFNGTTVKQFRGKTGDNVLTIIGRVGIAAFSFSGRTISPSTLKFDIEINGTAFGYTQTGSRLALLTKVKSKQLTKQAGQSADTAIQFGADASPVGFFSWATSADIWPGQTSASVIVSALQPTSNDQDPDDDGTEVSKLAAFSFDAVQPAYIAWDPEISADTGSNANSAFRAFAAPMALIAMIAAAFLFA